MALIVKPLPVAAPSNATVNRPVVAGARGQQTASLSGPVESLTHVSGSALGDGAFSAAVTQDDSNYTGRSFTPGSRRQPGDELPNPRTGIVDFTSQGFVELLELRETFTSGSANVEAKNRGKAKGMGLEHASSLYEAVIDIAAGNRNLRGETISLTL